MSLPEALRPFAELVEARARKNGHTLEAWYRSTLVLQEVPPTLVKLGVERLGARHMTKCRVCGTYVAFVSEGGIEVSRNDFDAPCRGPEESSAA